MRVVYGGDEEPIEEEAWRVLKEGYAFEGKGGADAQYSVTTRHRRLLEIVLEDNGQLVAAQRGRTGDSLYKRSARPPHTSTSVRV